MIDLISFRNWLLRLLAGGNTVVLNANIWARIDFKGHNTYVENVTMLKDVPAGSTGSQFPPPATP